jgi:hypothetical protein
MKCWRCEGDHLYSDFPHKSERMRIFHNIQKSKIVECNDPNRYDSKRSEKCNFFFFFRQEGNDDNS